MDQLKYYLNEFIVYRKERFPLRIYIPFAFYLAIASTIGSPILKTGTIFVNAGLILLLLFQFRLWDDLHSRRDDRAIYPQRLLCKTNHVHSYWRVLIGLSAICLGIIFFYSLAIAPVVLYLILLFFQMIVYYWMPFNSGPAYSHLLMIKYVIFPLIAAWLAPEAVSLQGLCLPLISIYLAMNLYEVIHDDKFRKQPERLIAISEGLALLLLMVAIMTSLGLDAPLMAKWMNVIVLISGVVFALMLSFSVKRIPLMQYIPHIMSLIQFLIILALKGD